MKAGSFIAGREGAGPGGLRVAFFVQGEGRGHMTQALALKRMLEGAGHSVVAVFMGENPKRPIPPFVRKDLGDFLLTYEAPVFVLDKRRKGVRPWSSLLRTIAQTPRYWDFGPQVHRRIRETRPHLIVNFYDLLGGLYTSLYRPGIPVVAVAHQFLFFHPEFPVVREKWWEIVGVRAYTILTALGASRRLALSFTPLPDLPHWRIRVVPPLLREAVLNASPRKGEHILTYVLNPGYAEELDRWQKKNPEVDLHCFWDQIDAPPTHSPRTGLTFHRLDDRKFLDLLSSSGGYASTAGFESICEAAFLGKPVMVVPTENHVEQRCNALDAARAGLATWRTDFDLTDLLAQIGEDFSPAQEEFKAWVRGAPDNILPLLEATAGNRGTVGLP